MHFYILPVLFPGLIIDILLTFRMIRSIHKNIVQVRHKRALAAFVAAPSYLITAFFTAMIYSADSRFQGQGVIGLILFLGIGIACTFIRLLLGVFLFMMLQRR